ncbi:MAG: hypothetical protein M5U12_32710 [Verrucomicrobia bacterium]|nr:hypothetical protein [Verrucomicrobiota bacterium]
MHVRTKFEEVLKHACTGLKLPVVYRPDPRQVTASELWAAVQRATWEHIPPLEYATDKKGQVHRWQPKPDKQPLVSPDLRDRIAHTLTWVLNPLSHSQTVDRPRQEIEDAIFAVAELEESVRRAIAAKHAGPAVLREMLLALLGLRLGALQQEAEEVGRGVAEG